MTSYPRAFTDAMKAAGWIREDSLLWYHPDGGKFYPYNTRGGIPEWRNWWTRGEVPPSDYEYFTVDTA